MPAPTFTRPVQGVAPNQFVQNTRDEAAINEALRQLWLAIAAGEGEEQVTLVLNAALSALSDADRAEVARDDAQGVLPDRLRRDVPTLIADDDLTYTAAQPGTVAENDIVRTRADGFSYQVLASGATDADVTTAGGVKLRQLGNEYGAASLFGFGAAGNGATDDTAILDLAANTGPITLGGKSYRLDGHEKIDRAYKIEGPGTLLTTTEAEPVIQAWGPFAHHIRNVTFGQPNSSTYSGGTNNDHDCLRLSGAIDATVEDVSGDGTDLGLHVGYGLASAADRRAYRANVRGARFTNLRGRGIEVFGVKDGHFSGLQFTGNNGAGGRASEHGVRVTAFDFALNEGNFIEGAATNFANGFSLQQYSYNNIMFIRAEDCATGGETHGQDQGKTAASVCEGNEVHLTALNCDQVLYDGGAYNSYHIHAQSCGAGILEQSDDGVAGVSVGNKYSGMILNTAGRLLDSRGDRTRFDLLLVGSNTTAATFGAIVAGTHASGRLKIENCAVGLQVSGSNANLVAEVNNCTTAVNITGANNTVHIETDGNVTITGAGCRLTGRVGGTITKSGAGNDADISGVLGYSSYKQDAGTTDASGFITFNHNLKTTPLSIVATVQTNNGWYCKVTNRTTTQMTFRVFSDDATTVNSTAVTIDWMARA